MLLSILHPLVVTNYVSGRLHRARAPLPPRPGPSASIRCTQEAHLHQHFRFSVLHVTVFSPGTKCLKSVPCTIQVRDPTQPRRPRPGHRLRNPSTPFQRLADISNTRVTQTRHGSPVPSSPHLQVVANDPFNSDPTDPELMSEEVRNRVKAGEQMPVGTKKIPMVDLPLGATEDRVCGTIDIEKALTEGG